MLKVKFFQVLVLATVAMTAVSQDTSDKEIIEIRGMTRTTLGSGANPNDLPMVKCVFRRDYPSNTTCQIITRNGSRCTTTYFTETTTNVVSPYQLSENKVLLHVRQSWNGHYDMIIKDNLTLIDMNTCDRVYNVSLTNKTEKLIVYEDGSYDVVLITREGMWSNDFLIEHYDASGQQSGQPLNVSLGWESVDIQAVSKKSNSRGYLVRGNPTMGKDPTGLKLLIPGESEVKDVLELNSRSDVISYLDDDKYYTVCGRRIDFWLKIVCKRLDLQTNKVVEVEFDWDKYEALRHVRASDSSIVVFGIEEEDYVVKKFFVVEIRLGEQTSVKKIDLPQWNYESSRFTTVRDNCKVRDFDGAARSFTLACEIHYPKRGAALRKFNLPN